MMNNSKGTERKGLRRIPNSKRFSSVERGCGPYEKKREGVKDERSRVIISLFEPEKQNKTKERGP